MQIIDILNSSKNWVMKWPVHSENGEFTMEAAGKHKVIPKFIEHYPKYHTIEVFQLYKTN